MLVKLIGNPNADITESLDKNGFISAHETGHAGGLYDDYVEDALLLFV